MENLNDKIPTETEIANLLDKLFGRNLSDRCEKLKEEFYEFKEAIEEAKPKFNSPQRMKAVIDELADVNAIIFHCSCIVGIPQRDLLEMAYDKIKWRMSDPNYKRNHVHESNNGCKDCANFMYGDKYGNGYCIAFASFQNCRKYRCQEYKSKNMR